MSQEVVVAGVGMHPFGRFEDRSAIELGVGATLEAMTDAGVNWPEIDAIYCAHMYAGTGAGHKLATIMGASGIPIVNVENACSSGGAALLSARAGLLSGDFETVLAVGLEKMPRGFMDMDYFDPWRRQIGHAVNPAQFAFGIQRHIHEFGTTGRQLATVAEKNHAHAVHNDRAMYRKPIGVDEILASRLIVDPLRLLMLCTPNEGAAAAILTLREPRRGEVILAGHGLKTAHRSQPIGEHMPTDSRPEQEVAEHVTVRAATEAYERAGVGPQDLDVVELQDTDSGSEIISTENLGLCQPGEGGALVESGETRLGGRIPVNPSGGLLSKGEPVGASGLGQVYEIVNQLRGRCGARQVPQARLGLTQALGAGGNCSVLVFSRS